MNADTPWICGVAKARVWKAAQALGYSVEDPAEDATLEQLAVFIAALDVYHERNVKYKDNWKRMGWRGQLIRIRERAERLWDDFWNKEGATGSGDDIEINDWEVDDALDLINFAGFFVRAVEAGNRDGEWWEGIC